MKKIDFTKLTKEKKVIYILSSCLLLILLFLGIFSFATRKHSSLRLQSTLDNSTYSMIALNSSAKKSSINKSQVAHYKFTKESRTLFSKLVKEEGNTALVVRINLKNKDQASSNSLLRFGFLYPDDFTSGGKFIKPKFPINNRIEIQADESDFTGLLDVSFALQKNKAEEDLPMGFYIYSDEKCDIVSACISPALIGFDNSYQVPFYGFAYNGGKIDFSDNSFNFSGSQMVFPGENSRSGQLPQFVVRFSEDEDFKSTFENDVKVEINFGGEKYFLSNVKGADKIIIPAGGLKNPFARVEIINNKDLITSIFLENVKVQAYKEHPLKAILTDPGLILNYKKSNWRDSNYEIFEWDRFPGIIFFDNANHYIQDRFFARLAFYVEKEGYRGTLVSNEFLQGKHAYNAHDYSSQSLTDFFNKAKKENFILNDEEYLLRDILIENGLMKSDGQYYQALDGGLVSISRETPEWSRINLLAHESWHTIFFKDEEFRNYVTAVYFTFDERCRLFLLDFFKSQPSLGYDQTDDYLIHNEFMAYIMQNQLGNVAKFFTGLANWNSVSEFTPELAAYVRESKAVGFEDAAIALNDFVFDKYGIRGGIVSLVNR
ncbi:MAG: hypothetical protein K5866_11195 [Treponema sp.]|nr:hypothetical protein [Treponema sp.]